ncbi:hypothetical protein CDD83_4386 [Cordyceps sp. RAO-2017]|nr:hypothetical protein CDD83_4386 [Cordyceps sp. RAO-2017]
MFDPCFPNTSGELGKPDQEIHACPAMFAIESQCNMLFGFAGSEGGGGGRDMKGYGDCLTGEQSSFKESCTACNKCRLDNKVFGQDHINMLQGSYDHAFSMLAEARMDMSFSATANSWIKGQGGLRPPPMPELLVPRPQASIEIGSYWEQRPSVLRIGSCSVNGLQFPEAFAQGAVQGDIGIFRDEHVFQQPSRADVERRASSEEQRHDQPAWWQPGP